MAGTVRVSQVKVSAEDDIGVVRISKVAVEVDDVPEQTGVLRISKIAVETDAPVMGTIRVSKITVETGDLPVRDPAFFWTGGARAWKPRRAYSGVTGAWT